MQRHEQASGVATIGHSPDSTIDSDSAFAAAVRPDLVGGNESAPVQLRQASEDAATPPTQEEQRTASSKGESQVEKGKASASAGGGYQMVHGSTWTEPGKFTIPLDMPFDNRRAIALHTELNAEYRERVRQAVAAQLGPEVISAVQMVWVDGQGSNTGHWSFADGETGEITQAFASSIRGRESHEHEIEYAVYVWRETILDTGPHKTEQSPGMSDEDEPTSDSQSSMKDLAVAGADLGTDFAPVVSNVKDATTALTGINPVTGEKVGTAGRVMARCRDGVRFSTWRRCRTLDG